jgi:hypothetical protein
MTVQHVISNVLNNTDAEYCKNWAVTEVREIGDGVWDKVCLLYLLLHTAQLLRSCSCTSALLMEVYTGHEDSILKR